MGFLDLESTEEIAGRVLTEFSDVGGLDEVINGILALQENTVYDMLVEGTPDDPRVDSGDYDEPDLFIKLASENMSKFPLNLPFSPLIIAKHVLLVHTFVYDLYSIRIDRELTSNDFNKIFYGDISTRTLLMLEEFDSEKETPQPTREFFKELGKVKWQDKKTKKLHKKLFNIRDDVVFKKFGSGTENSIFIVSEKAFILLLSGCSAVLDGRDKINISDLVRGNLVYLKLIDTDISKLM